MKRVILTSDEELPFYIPIEITNTHAQANIEETLNKHVETQLLLNINPVNDAEPVRYKPSLNTSSTIMCNFLNKSLFSPSYINAGFNKYELYKQSPSLKKCIFFFEYYNTASSSNQVLLARQVSRATDKAVFSFDINNSLLPFLHISPSGNDEFNIIPIPKLFTGNQVFLKIRFFNSKTGKINSFQTVANDFAEESSYLSINLLPNNTYSLTQPDIETINIYETTLYSNSESDSSLLAQTTGVNINLIRNTYNPLKNDTDIIP